MRNLILIAATTALSLQANAQKIELGANVGGNFSSSQSASHFSPDFSLKAAYNISRLLQVGISSSVHWQACEINYTALYFEDNLSGPPVDIQMKDSRAVSSIKAFVNARQHMGKTVLYTGFSGGYVTAFPRYEFFASTWKGLRSGYTVGGQAGATFYITGKLGINAELSANYINMNGDNDYNSDKSRTRLSGWNFPVSVGIRYNIGCSHGCCPFSKQGKTTQVNSEE